MAQRHRTVDAGKKYERQVAKYIQGEKQSRSHYGQSLHDVEKLLPSGWRLIIECKLRANIATARWLEQAEKYATGAGDVALVVCKEKGRHLEDSLAVMRLGDLRELLEKAAGGGGDD